MRNWDLLQSPLLSLYQYWRAMRRRVDGGIDVDLTPDRYASGVQSKVPIGELLLADMLSIAAVVIAPPGVVVQAKIILTPYRDPSQFYYLAGTSILGNGGPQEVYLSGPVRGDALPFNGWAIGNIYVQYPPADTTISITGWQLALNEIATGPMTLPTIEAPVVVEPPIEASVALGGLADEQAESPAPKGGAGALLLIGAAALALGGRRKRK